MRKVYFVFAFSLLLLLPALAASSALQDDDKCKITGKIMVTALNQTDSHTYKTVPFVVSGARGNVVYEGDVRIIECRDLGSSVNVTVELTVTERDEDLRQLIDLHYLNPKIANKKFMFNFIVDKRTNTFELNGTRVLFPFYLFKGDDFRPFHIFEFLKMEKENRINAYLGDNTKVIIRDAVILKSTRDFTYVFCSGSITGNITCEDPVPVRYTELVTKSSYVAGANLLYPRDPFGLHDGPVLLGFQLIPSDEIIEVLKASDSTNKIFWVVPVGISAGIGLLILRRRR
ncbi:hypothetical protein [Pyrococcus yayanosii]|uniref:Uncharacterized protein n=1 Tax=Pyrococcus yayanosii (strain CH1 / JCM 16557) TaxID=529709 RepID=F8AFB7_PYRYC|nr:hypothetical protein [Pyrococcus yayanosii]AEH24950.1 hypothetical protein PYCH_12780 [Pyrococcus yayanosii CH1]